MLTLQNRGGTPDFECSEGSCTTGPYQAALKVDPLLDADGGQAFRALSRLADVHIVGQTIFSPLPKAGEFLRENTVSIYAAGALLSPNGGQADALKVSGKSTFGGKTRVDGNLDVTGGNARCAAAQNSCSSALLAPCLRRPLRPLIAHLDRCRAVISPQRRGCLHNHTVPHPGHPHCRRLLVTLDYSPGNSVSLDPFGSIVGSGTAQFKSINAAESVNAARASVSGTLEAGYISATKGDVAAQRNVVAITGDVIATAGGLKAVQGAVNVAGVFCRDNIISMEGDIIAQKSLVANTGDVRAAVGTIKSSAAGDVGDPALASSTASSRFAKVPAACPSVSCRNQDADRHQQVGRHRQDHRECAQPQE